MLAKAIKELKLLRDELVILIKVYLPVASKYSASLLEAVHDHGNINQKGLSRKHIFDAVKNSLERLQLDYIDHLHCHRFDHGTPIEETMQALHDVVKAGYVRYIGMSSCYAYRSYAVQNKLTPFISMQNQYSLMYREEERETFPTLKLFGVGAIPYSPLGRGVLARPLSEQTQRSEDDVFGVGVFKEWAGTNDIVSRVEELAKKKGFTMAQVALAWQFAKDCTTSVEKLGGLLGALDVELTPYEVKYLEEPYKPLAVHGFA